MKRRHYTFTEAARHARSMGGKARMKKLGKEGRRKLAARARAAQMARCETCEWRASEIGYWSPCPTHAKRLSANSKKV